MKSETDITIDVHAEYAISIHSLNEEWDAKTG